MLEVKVFGQSHAPAIGCVIDGLPAGFCIDMEKLGAFLGRRAPGKNKFSTARREADVPEFISGLVDNVTCGAPVCAIIRNNDTKSGDYSNLKDVPRPAHSDYTAYVKYGGFNDIRGGGQFSGRLTAAYCIAGGIALQILEKRGISVAARIKSIHGVEDAPYLDFSQIKKASEKEFSVISDSAGELMKAEIEKARENLDSVGGVIECAATGVNAGLGDLLESRISWEVFSVPAVKGIEFGSGFYGSSLYGSENNDPFIIKNGRVCTETNNHGGILGGIASGMPIVFRAAIKPTPSIGKEQRAVSLSKMEETSLVVNGRHDPCIVQRAVPVMEAAMAIAILKAE